MVWLLLFSMTILWNSAVSYSAGKPAIPTPPIAPVVLEQAPILPPAPKDSAYGQPAPAPEPQYDSYSSDYKAPVDKPQQQYDSYVSDYKAPVEKPQQYGSYGSDYKAPVEKPQQYGSYGSDYKAPVEKPQQYGSYGSDYKAPVEKPQQYGSYGSEYKVPEKPQQYASYGSEYKTPEKPKPQGSYGSSYKAPAAYSPQVSKGQIATGSYGMPTGKPDSIQKCHCYVVPSYEAYPPMGSSPYGGGNGPLAAAPGFNALPPIGQPPMGPPPMGMAPPAAGGLSPSDINNLISANPQQAMTIANQLGVPVSSLASLAQQVPPEQLQSLLSSFAG